MPDLSRDGSGQVLTFTLGQARFNARSTPDNPCVSKHGLNFGTCVQDHLQSQTGHCRLTTGERVKTDLRPCLPNDSSVSDAVARLLLRPLPEIVLATGCEWSCTTQHVDLRLDSMNDIPPKHGNNTYHMFFLSKQQGIEVASEYESHDFAAFVADLGSYLGLLIGVGLTDIVDYLFKVYPSLKKVNTGRSICWR